MSYEIFIAKNMGGNNRTYFDIEGGCRAKPTAKWPYFDVHFCITFLKKKIYRLLDFWIVSKLKAVKCQRYPAVLTTNQKQQRIILNLCINILRIFNNTITEKKKINILNKFCYS